MTKIGNAFVNMNHVFMVYPTTAIKKPFDFQSGKNYIPTLTIVSAVGGEEVVIDVGDEYTDKNNALMLAKEYLSTIDFN